MLLKHSLQVISPLPAVHSHPAFGACKTYSSMALFHIMTYPDNTKDSMLTMCVFPRSVPTYSHLLMKGRWQNVILEKRKQKRRVRTQTVTEESMIEFVLRITKITRTEIFTDFFIYLVFGKKTSICRSNEWNRHER